MTEIEKKELANSYQELLEIFNQLNEADINKIPKDELNMYAAKQNIQHGFIYDKKKNFDEQNISLKTKELLALIFVKYWANEKQKEKIKKYDESFLKKEEQLKRTKYNPDNIFNISQKRNDDFEAEEKSHTNTEILKIEQKSIFKKIIYYINTFLNKFKK